MSGGKPQPLDMYDAAAGCGKWQLEPLPRVRREIGAHQDSPRQVDWKAYAREAPLLVKEYVQGASELRIFDFAQLGALDQETRLSQLARWVVDAEAHGERYGLMLPGAQIAPDRGPEHRHRCLATLARFGLERGER